jgi:C1A family cysteine protease
MAARKRTSPHARKGRKSSPQNRRRTAPVRRDPGGRHARRVLNILPSKDPEKDWVYENATEAGLLTAPASIPSSKDLRKPWWTINDQGSTGSCVGWATADSVLRWMFVQAGRLTTRQMLSARFVWMAAKETDEFITRPTTFIEDDGTSLKAALDIARKYGSVHDSVLPFKTGTLYPNPAKTFYALASQLKITSYFNLKNNLGNWRSWLATTGPILTRLEVDSTWYAATENGGNLDVYQPPASPAGHAVAIVGYTTTGFIVRNSWGTGWGDKGYGYASSSYAQAAFTEAYGVTL